MYNYKCTIKILCCQYSIPGEWIIVSILLARISHSLLLSNRDYIGLGCYHKDGTFKGHIQAAHFVFAASVTAFLSALFLPFFFIAKLQQYIIGYPMQSWLIFSSTQVKCLWFRQPNAIPFGTGNFFYWAKLLKHRPLNSFYSFFFLLILFCN